MTILAVVTGNAQLTIPVFPIAIGGAVSVDGALVVVTTGEEGDHTQAGEEILIAGGACNFAVFQHRATAFLKAAHGGNGRSGVADTGGGRAARCAAANGVVFHLRAILAIDTKAANGQSAGRNFRSGVGYTVGAAVHGAVAAHQTEAALIAVFAVSDGHSIIDQRAAAPKLNKRHAQIVMETASCAVAGDHTRIALSAGAHADTGIGRT